MGIQVQPCCCDRFLMVTGGKQTKFTTTGANARIRNYDPSWVGQSFDVDGPSRRVFFERSAVGGGADICHRTLDGKELTYLIHNTGSSSNGVTVSGAINLLAYSTVNEIRTADLTGANVQTIHTLNNDTDRFLARSMVIDEDHGRLLFCRANPLSSPTQSPAIKAVPLGGGAATTVLNYTAIGSDPQLGFSWIARDRVAKRIFVVLFTFTGQQIWSCDDEGGSIALVYTQPYLNGLPTINSLHTTSHDQKLWWQETNNRPGSAGLHSADLDGGNERLEVPQTKLAGGPNGLIVGAGFTDDTYRAGWGR